MIDHFGFAAPVYDRLLGPPDARRLSRLLNLPAAGRLLDAGGGTGRASAPLGALTDGLIVTDISPPMLRQARRRGLTGIAAASGALPFPEGSFSRILVVDALHHFQHQARSLLEFYRLLVPGGRLVIEEPDIRRFAVRIAALGERLLGMGSRFYPPPAIRAAMAEAGFHVHTADRDLFRVWIVGDKPV